MTTPSTPSKSPFGSYSTSPSTPTLSTPSTPTLSSPISQLRDNSAFNQTMRDLQKKCQKQRVIVTSGNNTKRLLTFVPVLTSATYLKKTRNQAGSYFDHIRFMSSDCSNEFGDPIAITYILDLLLTSAPKTFHKFLEQKSLTKRHKRLDGKETLALMDDCGLNVKQVTQKIDRHISKHLGHRIFAPAAAINEFEKGAPEPSISDHVVEIEQKNSENETEIVEEKITLMTHNVSDAFKKYFIRYIQYNYDHLPQQLDYKISEQKGNGIMTLIGTDHGQGMSQFLLRVLIASSKERRTSLHPEFGNMSIPIATAYCKREKDAIDLTKSEISTGIELLKNNMLVGVVSDKNKLIQLEFVPIDATDMSLTDELLTYVQDDFVHVVISHPGKLRVFVKRFVVACSGDLSALMYIQGRGAMSPHECILCDKKKSEWKDDTNEMIINQRVGRLTHTQKLLEKLWPIDDDNFMVPLLHMLIGTGNHQIIKHLLPFLLRVQPDNDESEKKLEMLDLLAEVESFTCNDEDMLIIQCKMRITVVRNTLRSLKGKLSRLTKNNKKKSNPMYLSQMFTSRNAVAVSDMELHLALTDLDTAKKTLTERIELNKQKQASIKVLEKEITTMMLERKNRPRGLDSRFEDILHSYNVQFTPYHGKTLTGVSCRRVMERSNAIMTDLIKICVETVRDRKSKGLLCPIDEDEIHETLTLHKHLLHSQDLVYSGLRIVDPSIVEMGRTRKDIVRMQMLWNKMEISKTPKAHLLFDHAADEQIKWGGLGDKMEDPLEKRHQIQMEYSKILMRIPDRKHKMRTQSLQEWRNSHPSVKRTITEVYHATKKIYNEPQGKRQRARPIMTEHSVLTSVIGATTEMESVVANKRSRDIVSISLKDDIKQEQRSGWRRSLGANFRKEKTNMG